MYASPPDLPFGAQQMLILLEYGEEYVCPEQKNQYL